jgi:hypothetical protein
MGGAIFQKEGVKVPEVPVTANKVKITISAKEIIQRMTLKVKPMTPQ